MRVICHVTVFGNNKNGLLSDGLLTLQAVAYDLTRCKVRHYWFEFDACDLSCYCVW
jgi:hypothetical protein